MAPLFGRSNSSFGATTKYGVALPRIRAPLKLLGHGLNLRLQVHPRNHDLPAGRSAWRQNLHAYKQFQRHETIYGRAGLNQNVSWIERLEAGDRVSVIPVARFLGWRNCVREASIKIYSTACCLSHIHEISCWYLLKKIKDDFDMTDILVSFHFPLQRPVQVPAPIGASSKHFGSEPNSLPVSCYKSVLG